MYGSGEIVATVNDYLFTNWAFVIKCVGGEYYQFSRPAKIAFLKPRRGWSLSREEPESVFLVARPGGRGVWGLFVCVCLCMQEEACVSVYMCVVLRKTSVKTSYACRPSCDRTEIYFLTPTNYKTCKYMCVGVRVCVCVEKKNINTHENLLYVQIHTLSPRGQRTIRLEMKFCVKLNVRMCVCRNVWVSEWECVFFFFFIQYVLWACAKILR